MKLAEALAIAIKATRKAKGLTQEDFGVVSSRTYLSSLERALKSPTIDKLEEISGVMNVAPATLLLLATALKQDAVKQDDVIEQVAAEAISLLKSISSDVSLNDGKEGFANQKHS